METSGLVKYEKYADFGTLSRLKHGFESRRGHHPVLRQAGFQMAIWPLRLAV